MNFINRMSKINKFISFFCETRTNRSVETRDLQSGPGSGGTGSGAGTGTKHFLPGLDRDQDQKKVVFQIPS